MGAGGYGWAAAVCDFEVGNGRIGRSRRMKRFSLAQIFGVTTDFLLKGVPGGEDVPRRKQVPVSGETPHAERREQDELSAPDEIHRAEVDQIMSSLDSGHGPQAVLVLGPPGIGKSVLASQLIHEAGKGWTPTPP